MKLKLLAVLTLMIALFCLIPLLKVSAAVTFTKNEWSWNSTTTPTGNGTNVFQKGGENPHSFYYFYETEAKALEFHTLYPIQGYDTPAAPSNSKWYLNLNGEWDFRYDVAPASRVWPTGTNGAFLTAERGFTTTGWDKIDVPCNIQVHWNPNGTFKYDAIAYKNIGYPWQNWNGNGGLGSSPATPVPTAYNGVGTHQREFTLGAEWADKRVFLMLDGADNFYIWVDGTPVGYSEDPMTSHEWDITDALKGGTVGAHTITVQVIRWSTGSWFEDQDFIRISGIFRNIYVTARNVEDLWDMQVDTAPTSASNMNGNWTFNLKTAVRKFDEPLKDAGASKRVYYKLIDADGKTVASGDATANYAILETDLTQAGYTGTFGGGVRWNANAAERTATNVTSTSISLAKPTFTATIPASDVHMWSAEDPYLYKLVVYVDNGAETEYSCIRVGFRYVQYSASSTATSRFLQVNGKRVTFYGTDVHEINPETGRVMTMDILMKDILTMKQNNVNAIRMSHYPHDHRYYDLADEYGIYIMDEANQEAHGRTGLTNLAQFGPMLRDRQLNMLERTKNHASVISWSSGNESGGGTVHRDYLIRVLEKREADITGRGGAGATTAGRPSHSQYDNGNAQLYSAMYPGISGWVGGTPSSNKPWVLCEYVHAMGNSNGGWDSWIAGFDRSSDTGGFIWDWVDQSILTPVPSSVDISAFAANGATGAGAISAGNNPEIFTGTGAASGPASYTNGQKYMKGHVSFPYINTDQTFTYDVDVYPTSTTANQFMMGIGDFRWGVKLLSSTQIQVWACNTSSNSWPTANFTVATGSSGNFALNRWHRVTVTRSGNTVVLYLDGAQISSMTVSPAVGTLSGTTSDPFSLGINYSKNSELWEGYIGNARVIGGTALTATQISGQGDRVPTAPVAGQTEIFRLALGANGAPPLKPPSGPLSEYYAFGGDWGEPNHDNNFCANGMLLADRTPKPQVAEMKRQYQHIITRLNGNPVSNSVSLTVKNKFMFTNANAYDMTWQITENGMVIRSGSGVFDVAPIPDGMTGNKYTEANFNVGFDKIVAKPNAEYFFNIQYRLRSDKNWAKAGHIVAENQLPLLSSPYINTEKPYPPISVSQMTVTGNTSNNTTGSITITGPDNSFVYTFDKANGRFSSMIFDGKPLIVTGPEPNFYRAPTDNEMNPGGRGNITAWQTVGSGRTRSNITYNITTYPNCITIDAPFTGTNLSSGSRTLYTIYPDGEVKVNETYVFGSSANNWCPQVGAVMQVSPTLENMTFFGRGPGENQVDRKWGSDVGLWNTTVTKNFTQYIVTQATGNHIDTRWLALTDDTGFGMVIKSGVFMPNNGFTGSAPSYNAAEVAYNADSLIEFNALHFNESEMSASRYIHPYMLYRDARENKPGEPIWVTINVASRGVGGDDSWSSGEGGAAAPHAVYRLLVAGKTFNYNYSIQPVKNFNATGASEYSRLARNNYQNVKDLMPLALAAGVPASDAAYAAANALTTAAADIAAINAYNDLLAKMYAIKPILNSATAAGVTAKPDANNVVKITVPYGANLSAITPVFETISTGTVAISPTGAQNFAAGSVTYTLTDGTKTNEYTVYVETAESARSITAFRLLGVDGVIIDNPSGATGVINVDLTAKGVVDLSNIAPDLITFAGQSITPDLFAARDFNNTVTYTVTAADGSQRVYSVVAISSTTAAITGFNVGGVDGVIDNVNNTISVLLPYGKTIPLGEAPEVTINGDSYSPTGAVNFTTPQQFTVTNGANQRVYNVTVSVDAGVDCDISSFTIGSYTGIISGSNITLSVPYGTNVTDVTPNITVGVGASYLPAGAITFESGVPQIFTVTSANGAFTKDYSVVVTVRNPFLVSLAPDQPSVFATTPTQGVNGLPKTVKVLTDTGDIFDADVTWNSATYTLNSTIDVGGAVSLIGSNVLAITAKVEVIHAGTVFWVNNGTRTTGSDLYDAVAAKQGALLLNERSDQAGSPSTGATGTWGYKQGQGNSTAARNVNPEERTGGYTTVKTETGYYTSDNTAGNNYEYRFPVLPAGQYTYVGFSMDWWSSSRPLRHQILSGTGTSATALVSIPSATTWTTVNTSGATFTGNFTLTAETQPILRVTSNGSGPTLAWITVYRTDNVTVSYSWGYDGAPSAPAPTTLGGTAGYAIGNNLPEPITRAGFNFDGWYTASGVRVTPTTVFSSNATLTAKWAPYLVLSVESNIVTLTATLSAKPDLPATTDAQLFLAVYNAKGVLVSTKYKTVSFGDEVIIETLTADIKAGEKAKAFLWNANYVPLVAAGELMN